MNDIQSQPTHSPTASSSEPETNQSTGIVDRYRIMFALGGLLLLSAVAVGGYFVGINKANKQNIANVPVKASPSVPVQASPSSSVNENTIAPETKPVTVPISSTVGWKSTTFKGVSFLIPADFTVKESDDRVLLYAPGAMVPTWIIVENYAGGSRRQQFLGKDSYDCKWRYEEGLFGGVSALQIAADPGQCQGTYDGGIVTVVGDKLVSVAGLYYDTETGKIKRTQLIDTIVSTLKEE